MYKEWQKVLEYENRDENIKNCIVNILNKLMPSLSMRIYLKIKKDK